MSAAVGGGNKLFPVTEQPSNATQSEPVWVHRCGIVGGDRGLTKAYEVLILGPVRGNLKRLEELSQDSSVFESHPNH